MNTAGPTAFAVWPPKDLPVSVLTWLKEVKELYRVTLSPPPFPDDAARGNNQPVIVVPGFCSPEAATLHLREFLIRQGFAPQSWGLGSNIGPTKSALAGLQREIEETAARLDSPIALIGVSLGGTIAREVAKRCPACIARVITVVSPVNLPVATPLMPLAQAAALVWDETARSELAAIREPPPMPVTAIVNPKDGVIDWRAALPEPAPTVETVMVDGFHMTMPSNPKVLRTIAARLAQLPA